MLITAQPRNIVNFCGAYIFSAFGYEFLVFVMTLYVYKITGEPLSVGIFTAVSLMPRLASPYYGSITDRYRKNRVFRNAACMTGILIILLGLFQNMLGIYVIWFFISIMFMVIMNVRTAIMTEVMPKDDFLKGNALVMISLNFARILAPLIGGFIIGFYSVQMLLVLGSVFYFLVALFSSMVRLETSKTSERFTAKKVTEHIREGVQYIFTNHDLRYLLFVIIGWRFFLGFQVSLFVVYIKTYLARGDMEFGLFMAMLGGGSILGSFCGPAIIKRVDSYRMIHWCLSFHYLSFVLLGLLHNYILALIIVSASYFLFFATVVNNHSLRDRLTKSEIRGRVYGSIAAITTPFGITSMLLGSYCAGLFGVEKVFIGGGVLATGWLLINGLLFSKVKLLPLRQT
jgi:MFS transporter, DHA3 family, macrolide efflux protein